MVAQQHTETQLPPVVPIKSEERRRWQHLLTEAITRNLTIMTIDEAVTGRSHQLRYHVSSYSEPTSLHEVIVETFEGGVTGREFVVTRCGCMAGAFEMPCSHAALAVEAADMWPSGMVIARQVGLPDPEIRREYHQGERVRISGTDRTGVVSGVRMVDGRPGYRVDDPDAHEPLGLYASYELLPAPRVTRQFKVDPTEARALLMGRRSS